MANAPRVLLANSNLVPKWATWEHFSELDRKGLMMYGQMTAGSWIYIGSQGIVQGTFETFVEAGRQHYNDDLSGKWILTAGLGGMGGAQPLAATLAGAVSLNIECQQASIDFRLRTRYLDKQAKDIDDAAPTVAPIARARSRRPASRSATITSAPNPTRSRTMFAPHRPQPTTPTRGVNSAGRSRGALRPRTARAGRRAARSPPWDLKRSWRRPGRRTCCSRCWSS